MSNIFREAKQLLDKKDSGSELTEEELQLIGTAEIPLMVPDCPLPEDMPVGECLEELANIVEESRGRVVVTQRPHEPFTWVRIPPPLPNRGERWKQKLKSPSK